MIIDFALPECTEDLLFATLADDGLPVRHRAGFGGRGSTKSHSFARRLLHRGFERPERILAAREIQRSIEGSVKALLDDLIPQMGFGPTNGDGFYHSQKYEILGRNGTTVNFAGLRTNIDSIASMEGITIAYVNEARAVSQNSINVLTPTIRAKATPGRPAGECWWDWNPGLPTDPVDVMFRGGEPPPGSIVRQLNYPENPWFGEPLKSEMEWVKRRDPDKYEHIWLGGYQRNSESRVFRNWRVEEFETPADAILRFGADWGFAVDPSVLIRMFIGRWEDGRAIGDPNGRCLFIDHEAYKVGCEIDETPALFAGDCPPDKKGADDRPLWTNPHNHPGVPGATKWLITADSSRPETVSYMKRKSFKIASAIKGPGSVEDGVEFLKTFDIIVHTRCTHSQDELTSYSWKTDPLTGQILPVLADKDNHCLVAGTLIQTDAGLVPIEDVRVGDQVMTRQGLRDVSFSGVTDIDRETIIVETTLGRINCTPDHEIYTARGFVRADALRYGDELTGDASWSKKSPIAARFISGIRRASDALIAATSDAASRAGRSFFTAKSGKTSTAQSLTGMRSTTRTKTPETTTPRIWSVYPLSSTALATPTIQSAGSVRLSTWSASARSPRHGTPVTKGERSTGKSGRWLGGISSPSRSLANSAPSPSCRAPSGAETASAPTPAGPRTAALRAWMTWIGSVRRAGRVSEPTASRRHRFVRGHVLTVAPGPRAECVYDLTVEGEHEFFANGVLVHNCIDALRYGHEGVRRTRAKRPSDQPDARTDYRGRNRSQGADAWKSA